MCIRDRTSRISNICIYAGIKLLYKVPCICRFEGSDDLFISGIRLSIQKVLFNRAVEQDWLLADIPNNISSVAS